MPTTRQDIVDRIRMLNHEQKSLDERAILVHQIQNMTRRRLLETLTILMPMTAFRLLLLPRFGFVIPKGIVGIGLDTLLPSAYFLIMNKRDRELYARLLGIDDRDEVNRDGRLKRMQFIRQFWSNSQYWH